jgi:PAS domain S-box-containing protein
VGFPARTATYEEALVPLRTRQLRTQRLRLRLWLPLCAMVLLFLILIFQIILPAFEGELIVGKEQAIRYLAETAVSVVAHYQRLEQNGELTRAAAQQAACDHLRDARYGPEMRDYFWITTDDGLMVMHPYLREIEGRDSAEIADEKLTQNVLEVRRAVVQQGEGFINYTWQWNDDPHRQIPKRAYIKHFAPWQWYVGTGVYLEDVAAETTRLRNRLLACLGTIFAVVTVLSGLTIRRNTRSEREREQAERALRDSEERLRTILDTLQAGVVIVDAETHEILDANPAALQMIGAKRAAVVGRICHKFICPAAHGQCPITDLGLTVEKANRVLSRADGNSLEIMKTVIPTDLNGRRVLLESFVDISAHVAAQRDLKRHVEQLSDAKSRLEVLVANITGREKRMVELKQEVNELLQELGRGAKYDAPDKVNRLLKAQALMEKF